MTRIVFLGTPEAALPTLLALSDSFEVGLVVTQPDRPRGRSGRPQPSPVKEKAQDLGIPVTQPKQRGEIASAISYAGSFDLGVVVAYGMILDAEVLALPEAGLLNVHFSLLPRWRGAAPVARALMAGDAMTGVTIIQLDEGLDTGPVLTAQAVDIGPEEDSAELTGRLARLGARLITSAIPGYLAGDIEPVVQSDDGATYAHKITAEDRPLDLQGTPAEFVARVRGLAPEPGATLEIDGERHKILRARDVEWAPDAGTWALHGDSPVVAVGEGGVELVELQPPGKRPQPGADWARGRRSSQGSAG